MHSSCQERVQFSYYFQLVQFLGTTLQEFPAVNKVSRAHCTVGCTCGINGRDVLLEPWDPCATEGIWLLWQQLSSPLRWWWVWHPGGQVRLHQLDYQAILYFSESAIKPADTSHSLQYQWPLLLPYRSMEAESLYFVQEVVARESGTTVCNTALLLGAMVVLFCYCMYSTYLLKHWRFYSLTFCLPNVFVYMRCTVQSMWSVKMCCLRRRLKQSVYQTVSPFPSPKKNQ